MKKAINEYNNLTKEIIKKELYNKDGKKLNANLMRKIKIPDKYKFCKTTSEYIYCILNDIKEIPLCLNCLKCKQSYYNKKYHQTCSNKCRIELKKKSSIKIKEITKKYIKEKLLDKNNNLIVEKIYNIIISAEYDFCKTTSEYIYCILNDINTYNKCKNDKCKNKTIFKNTKQGYHLFCSTKCSNNDKEKQEKAKRTSIEKYGVEHPTQSKIIKEKVEKYFVNKYGVKNPAQSKIVKDKKEKSNIKKYGFKTSFQNEEVKKKIKETMLNRYGVENYKQKDIYDIDLTKEKIMKEYIGKNNKINYQKVRNIIISNKYSFCKTKKEYFFCILNDITEKQICIECKKNSVNFNRKSNKYNKYCSPSCSSSSKETQEKTKKTNLKKYGVPYVLQNETIKKKKEETNIKRYGKRNYIETDLFKRKSKEIHMEKYRVDNIFKQKNMKEKIKKTNIKRYGTENIFKNKEVKKKIKETNIKRYGTENYKLKDVKDINEYLDLFKNKINYQKWIKDGFFLLNEVSKYYNVSISTINRLKRENNINILNKPTKKQTQKEIYDYILEEFKKVEDINKEFNNIDTITYNNRKVIFVLNKENKRKILELDIYLKKYNFAIEYNGLMFHSFGKSKHSIFNNYIKEYEYIYNDLEKDNKYIKYQNKDKHLLKTELCEEKGIHLLHVNEDEWLDVIKQKIWKRILKKAIKSNFLLKREQDNRKQNKNYIEITTQIDEEIKNFLKNNSLKKYIKSNIFLMLKDKESKEIKGVMLLSKSKEYKNNKKYKDRKQNGEEYIINNYCLNIKDGKLDDNKYFNLLLKTFEEEYNPKLIEIKVNRRWINKNNNIYLNNNFQLKEVIKPDYYYFNDKNNKDIINLKTKNIENKQKEDVKKYEKGYRKIYDSGYLLYEKKY